MERNPLQYSMENAMWADYTVHGGLKSWFELTTKSPIIRNDSQAECGFFSKFMNANIFSPKTVCIFSLVHVCTPSLLFLKLTGNICPL